MMLTALCFGLQIISFILDINYTLNTLLFSFEVLCCFIQKVFPIKVALKVQVLN